MSNTRLFLLVLAALFLVVIFGRSPMDEVRKKRAERAGMRLIEKIKEANQKNSVGSRPPVIQPNYAGPNTPPVPIGRYGNAADPDMSGATPNNVDPYLQQQRQRRNNPNAPKPVNPNAPPKDDYYPPKPTNPNATVPLSSLKQSEEKLEASKIFKNPNNVTDDGQDLAFWGTKVYVYDKDGNIKPMPDGSYKMYDGTFTMVVRNGEQSIGNGDTVFWR